MTAQKQFVVRDQRRDGWFSVDNEIIDKFGTQLGAYGVALYAVLARYCKNSTQQVNLSQRDMAQTLGISQSRVRESLSDLVGAGIIHLEVPERPSPGIISTITILDVKVTERHTLSSAREPDAARERNKEVKTNTKTKTETPPILNSSFFSLKETARAREITPEQQEGFDQRDLRALHKAKTQMEMRGGLSGLSDEEMFTTQCELAGLSVKKALEAIGRGRKWPLGESA